MTLVEQSLLRPVDDPTGGVRYGMLETIRSFGRARLEESGESEAVRDLHANAYAELAERAGPAFPSAQQVWWLDRLEADDANLLAATNRAITRPLVRDALRLVGGLWRYWLQTGRLAAGRVLAHAAIDLDGSEAWPGERLKALDAAGGVEYWSGDVPSAHALYEEELALAQRSDDRPMQALAYLNLFFTREYRHEYASANEAHVRALALFAELGDTHGLSRVKLSVPIVLFARTGPMPEAEASEALSGRVGPDDLEALADEFRAAEDAWDARGEPLLRTLAAWQRGDIAAAARWFAEGLRDNLAVRERSDTALALQMAVIASLPMEEPVAGATIHGATLTAFERLGIRPPASFEDLSGTDPLPILVAILGQEGFDEAVARGRRMSLEEAVDILGEMVDRYLARVSQGP
jgi:hypothetical protein